MAHLVQTLQRTQRGTEYLEKVKYHDLVHWMMVETFVAYSKVPSVCKPSVYAGKHN